MWRGRNKQSHEQDRLEGILPVGDNGCHGDQPRQNPLPTTTGRPSEDGSKLGIGAVVRGAGLDPAGPGCAAQREGKAGGEPVLVAGSTLKEGWSELAGRGGHSVHAVSDEVSLGCPMGEPNGRGRNS
eukprot:2093055-Rhodomonas_salina.2